MALIQAVQNGKIVDETNSTSQNEKTNSMGQDQFLQLLVAQMQYQDPLEPTSNTEWVSQMATFSMVESLNNMQEYMSQQSANSLVGKYVLLKVTGSDGNVNYVKGKVDYITEQNGKTMLSVNDKLYSIDTLDTVADEEYYKGSELANTLHEMIQTLPGDSNMSSADEGLVKSVRELYDSMTDAQKEFVTAEDLTKLNSYETRINALKATQFIAMTETLPTSEQLTASTGEARKTYEADIAAAREYYDDLTEKQKANVTEEALETLEALESILAEKEQAATQNSENEVADLLKKILEEVQTANTKTD